MSDLAEFLNARMDEDEAVAQAATAGPWEWVPDGRDGDVMLVAPSVQHTYETSYGLGSSPEQVIAAIGTNSEGWVCVGDQDAAHIARWDPGRVLAEVAAKRRLARPHGPGRMGEDVDGEPARLCRGHNAPTLYPCTTLRVLVHPYAGHPDFDPAWRLS